MITVGKVRNAEYYLNELEQDDAYDYYGGLERTGQWHGTFAADLGLEGAVDPEDFRAILAGARPDSGTSLTEFPIKVPALDVTLSVPKSMSVLWAVADHDTRQRIEQALTRAEEAVIQLLEAEATVVRRGHGGIESQQGQGLIVASFDHHTSRLGDPNLHRHLVVANASPGTDGRVTGIHTRHIYGIRYTSEAVFQSVLRNELAQSEGSLFTEVDRHGAAEIAGVDRATRREFSQRRRDIELEMADRGVSTGQGARFAALATRPNKEDELPDDVLRRQWRDRANELGFDQTRVPTLVREPSLALTEEQLAFAVTEHQPVYSRRDVIRHVARSAESGAAYDVIRHVARSAESGAAYDVIMQRSEDFLASEYAVERLPGVYSTPEIIQLETRAVERSLDGLGQGIGQVTQHSIDQALGARPHLADEQQALVQHAATTGDAITVVVGKAGAGKTTALDALRDAYERDNHRVIGAALSARAAAELSSGAGIKSHTIHRTISQIAAGDLKLDDRTVLIIDEAGMVGTRQLAQLIEEAHRVDAKLVLVGDPRQLPEVDAGGTFSAIGHRIQPLELTENRRQQDPNERAALDALRTDNVDSALTNLHRSGHLTIGDNSETVRSALVSDWHNAESQGQHAVMIAARRSDVTDLNDRARQHLTNDGRLGPAIWTNDTVEFSIGDRVMAHRNRYDLGVLNGNQGHVTGTTPKSLAVELDSGKTVLVPNDYIDEGHLGHGYALTVHKAQGMTCDAAYLLGDDGLFNELGYTGLSRGRHENHLYTVASRDELGRPALDPLANVRQALGINRAQTAAIDIGGPDIT